jgi:hypothetical protein
MLQYAAGLYPYLQDFPPRSYTTSSDDDSYANSPTGARAPGLLCPGPRRTVAQQRCRSIVRTRAVSLGGRLAAVCRAESQPAALARRRGRTTAQHFGPTGAISLGGGIAALSGADATYCARRLRSRPARIPAKGVRADHKLSRDLRHGEPGSARANGARVGSVIRISSDRSNRGRIPSATNC